MTQKISLALSTQMYIKALASGERNNIMKQLPANDLIQYRQMSTWKWTQLAVWSPTWSSQYHAWWTQYHDSAAETAFQSRRKMTWRVDTPHTRSLNVQDAAAASLSPRGNVSRSACLAQSRSKSHHTCIHKTRSCRNIQPKFWKCSHWTRSPC